MRGRNSQRLRISRWQESFPGVPCLLVFPCSRWLATESPTLDAQQRALSDKACWLHTALPSTPQPPSLTGATEDLVPSMACLLWMWHMERAQREGGITVLHDAFADKSAGGCRVWGGCCESGPGVRRLRCDSGFFRGLLTGNGKKHRLISGALAAPGMSRVVLLGAEAVTPRAPEHHPGTAASSQRGAGEGTGGDRPRGQMRHLPIQGRQ